jgi:hypothetical protein
MDRTLYFDELVSGDQKDRRGGINIPKPAFIKEHVNLIDILKTGTKSSRRKEAADQKKELMKVLNM